MAKRSQQEEEDESFVIIEERRDDLRGDANPSEHGGLVKKILSAQREFQAEAEAKPETPPNPALANDSRTKDRHETEKQASPPVRGKDAVLNWR